MKSPRSSFRFATATLLMLALGTVAFAQSKVLTPGKLKISELEPTEDLNGKLFTPPLEQNQGMIQITLDPAVEKYFKLEDVQRWFSESRFTIDQLVFDRTQVTVRRDGDITIRYSFSFLTGQNDVSRRVQIRKEATDGTFANYFMSHKFFRQKVTRLLIGIGEEPVLEAAAEGRVAIAAEGFTDLEIEAVGSDGVPRRFFDERTFVLPPGSYTISITKQGYEAFRRRITVSNGKETTVEVALKASSRASGTQNQTQAPVLVLKNAADIEARKKAVVTIQARRPVLGGLFTPDGSKLITWNADNLLYVWDLEKGTPLFGLTGHTTGILHAAYYPEKDQILSVSETAIIIHDLKTSKALTTINARDFIRSGFRAAHYIPEFQTIIANGKDQTIRTWNVSLRKEGTQLESAAANRFISGAESRRWVALLGNGIARLRTSTNAAYSVLSGDGNLTNGFLTKDGKYMVAGSENEVYLNNSVSIFKLTGANKESYIVRASNPLAYFNNGLLVALDNNTRALTLFNAKTNAALLTAKGINAGEKMAVLSDDGRFFATSTSGNDFLVYDLYQLEEWKTLLSFATTYNNLTIQAEKLSSIPARLKKPVHLFKDATTMLDYEARIGEKLSEFTEKSGKTLSSLWQAQLDFINATNAIEQKLGSQENAEQKNDFERRIDDAITKVKNAKKTYSEIEASQLTILNRVFLTAHTFEWINESTGIPVKSGTIDAQQKRLPLQFGALETFVEVSPDQMSAFSGKISSPSDWVLDQSDLTVSPVVHRIRWAHSSDDNPIFLGGKSLTFDRSTDSLFTNLFTINLKASGFITFTLTDPKSIIKAKAVKDGVGQTTSIPKGKKLTPNEFRPGTYELTISSKKFKNIDKWTVHVAPGVSQSLSLDQFKPKQPHATIVFNGSEFPYTVSLIQGKKVLHSYVIWSKSQAVDVPRGKFTLTYSKPGYTVNGKQTIKLVKGMREEVNLAFTKTGGPNATPVSDPLLVANMPSTVDKVKKKSGAGKWLLFLAATGGGGYVLYGELTKAGPPTLPGPPSTRPFR